MASHHQTVAAVPSELLDVVRAARALQASLDGSDGDVPIKCFPPVRRQLRDALAKLDALP